MPQVPYGSWRSHAYYTWPWQSEHMSCKWHVLPFQDIIATQYRKREVHPVFSSIYTKFWSYTTTSLQRLQYVKYCFVYSIKIHLPHSWIDELLPTGLDSSWSVPVVQYTGDLFAYDHDVSLYSGTPSVTSRSPTYVRTGPINYSRALIDKFNH